MQISQTNQSIHCEDLYNLDIELRAIPSSSINPHDNVKNLNHSPSASCQTCYCTENRCY